MCVTKFGSWLVRAHADVVSGGVVAADGEGAAAAAGADDDGAADARGVLPDDLRPVAADAAAGVGGVVVGAALGGPGADDLRGAPADAAPPEEVLAVGPLGVHQQAVPAPLVRVPPRVPGQPSVPRHRRHAHRKPRRVVQLQELPRQASYLSSTAAAVRRRTRSVGGDEYGECEEEETGGGRSHGVATSPAPFVFLYFCVDWCQ